jgi:hypothetical protein
MSLSNLVPESHESEPATAVVAVVAPVAEPAPHHGGLITCEGCGSRITRAKGELFEVGARIKAARKSEDKIENLESRIVELERELASARAEVKALTPAPAASAPKRAGWGS